MFLIANEFNYNTFTGYQLYVFDNSPNFPQFFVAVKNVFSTITVSLTLTLPQTLLPTLYDASSAVAD
jgi:hypothetical protein